MICPQCGKRGLKGHQGVAMHVGRVHDLTILPPFTEAAVAAGGKKYRKARQVQIEDQADHAEPALAIATRDNPEIVLKRTTRTREVAVTEEATLHGRQFSVNGCPNCLNMLKPMIDAYAKLGVPAPPYCPFCTCPVGMVRTALRVQDKIMSLVPA